MPGIPEYFEGGNELEAAVLGFADGGATHLNQADANAHFKELQFRVTLVLVLQHCGHGGHTTPDMPMILGLELGSCVQHSQHPTPALPGQARPGTLPHLSAILWADIKHPANTLCLKMKSKFCSQPLKLDHSSKSLYFGDLSPH